MPHDVSIIVRQSHAMQARSSLISSMFSGRLPFHNAGGFGVLIFCTMTAVFTKQVAMAPSQIRKLRLIATMLVLVNVMANIAINAATDLLPAEIRSSKWIVLTVLGICILLQIWLANLKIGTDQIDQSASVRSKRKFSKTSILRVGTALVVLVAVALVIVQKLGPITVGTNPSTSSPGPSITLPPPALLPEPNDNLNSLASLILMIVGCAVIYMELSWEYINIGATTNRGCLARLFTLLVLPLAIATMSSRNDDRIRNSISKESLSSNSIELPPDNRESVDWSKISVLLNPNKSSLPRGRYLSTEDRTRAIIEQWLGINKSVDSDERDKDHQ